MEITITVWEDPYTKKQNTERFVATVKKGSHAESFRFSSMEKRDAFVRSAHASLGPNDHAQVRIGRGVTTLETKEAA